MSMPKLTGLEYYWFTQSQLMVTRYANYWDMALDPAAANVVLVITEDAKSCYTGPQSLQRLAERLNNEAADIAMTATVSKIDKDKLKRDNRRIAAMRYLCSRFLVSAEEIYEFKRSARSLRVAENLVILNAQGCPPKDSLESRPTSNGNPKSPRSLK
ncbi:hypothetical protein [Methylobacterium sp. Leaf456]|uniref:hypothetical protein n=1 Tax=Methylobacterium sp. Leaf456 TaxID=1736382 RepID=UPI0012E36BE5|nr:hypothetical protein [Methylobacterium sp. Leaf456]